MTLALRKALYTAEATVRGGRDHGHGRSADGMIDVDLRIPVEMGGPGGGTNPEELFAVGYAACFQSAMGVVGRRLGVDTGDSTITSRVTVGPIEGGAFGMAVELQVELPGVGRAVAQRVVHDAHQLCPYSNATRGNIDVSLVVLDRSPS
ncbi:MAG TPA: organic hydroperoxide resistance protein [Gemmatimonadales bacterium]|nr:organic hydroperoxide resistance protein [Gemmatimonadales bacterium]